MAIRKSKTDRISKLIEFDCHSQIENWYVQDYGNRKKDTRCSTFYELKMAKSTEQKSLSNCQNFTSTSKLKKKHNHIEKRWQHV